MTKKTLTLLFASAALTALALPAWSALHAAAPGETVNPLSALFSTDGAERLMMLAEDDDHDEDGGKLSRRPSSDDEAECENDDGNCGPAAAAPAPAGTVAPAAERPVRQWRRTPGAGQVSNADFGDSLT